MRVFLVMMLFWTTAAMAADTDQQTLVDKAAFTVNSMLSDPEFKEARQWVNDSKGVLIVPSLLKAGFFFGAEGGSAVLLARTNNGWSAPAFYSIANASFGFQIGGQSAEVIFVIKTEKGLDAVVNRYAKLGGDVSLAMWDMGKGLEAGTGLSTGADIYAIARTAGVYGGITLEGGALLPRDSWNSAYYGQAVSVADILAGKVNNQGAAALQAALR